MGRTGTVLHVQSVVTAEDGCREEDQPVCVFQMETNPVLKNITDYLIEEVSAEEEELTGASGGNGDDAGDGKDPSSSEVTVETDEKLLKVGGAPPVCYRLTLSVCCFIFTCVCVCRCWTGCCSTCVWFTL